MSWVCVEAFKKILIKTIVTFRCRSRCVRHPPVFPGTPPQPRLFALRRVCMCAPSLPRSRSASTLHTRVYSSQLTRTIVHVLHSTQVSRLEASKCSSQLQKRTVLADVTNTASGDRSDLQKRSKGGLEGASRCMLEDGDGFIRGGNAVTDRRSHSSTWKVRGIPSSVFVVPICFPFFFAKPSRLFRITHIFDSAFFLLCIFRTSMLHTSTIRTCVSST